MPEQIFAAHILLSIQLLLLAGWEKAGFIGGISNVLSEIFSETGAKRGWHSEEPF